MLLGPAPCRGRSIPGQMIDCCVGLAGWSVETISSAANEDFCPVDRVVATPARIGRSCFEDRSRPSALTADLRRNLDMSCGDQIVMWNEQVAFGSTDHEPAGQIRILWPSVLPSSNTVSSAVGGRSIGRNGRDFGCSRAVRFGGGGGVLAFTGVAGDPRFAEP